MSIHPGPGVADPESRAQLRAGMHGMWQSVAPAWEEHAEFIDARARPITERLLDGARVGAGDRVLELGCGAGGLGLVAAERVGAAGEVVLSDVAEGMVTVAARRARARGLTNVLGRVLDAEAIDEPDGSYDVVLCRDGLMFTLDPAHAVRELHRVLRPGGRFALGVWGPRENNPWLAIMLDALSHQLGAPVPPPGVPGPFALQDQEFLRHLLSSAGLETVVEEVSVPMAVASFEEWWDRTRALAGPVSRLLGSLDPQVADRVREQTRSAAAGYERPEGLVFPGLQVVASGSRAAA